LQLAQTAALLEGQSDPVAAFPLEQVQLLAWQAAPLRVQPWLQLAQIAPLLEMQLDPAAAIPSEQEHTLAWQALPLRVQPVLHD
jgi:hypothetical protein